MSSVGRSSDGYLRKYKSDSERRKQNKIQQQRLGKIKGSIMKFMATEHVAVDEAHHAAHALRGLTQGFVPRAHEQVNTALHAPAAYAFRLRACLRKLKEN
jgi:hypothetical protein